MDRARLSALTAAFLLSSACTATGEPPRPARVVEAVAKVVDGLANETAQRLATDAFRGLPVVVRSVGSGSDVVVAELLRTRLVERALPVEVDCPAKCMEVGLLEFVSEAAGPRTLAPGQLLATGPSVSGYSGPAHGDLGDMKPGRASTLLVTFSVRDGNRLSVRQQLIAVLAVAFASDAPR